MRQYFLKPGYIFFAVEPSTIMTVLGSCVAVTLFDRTMRLGGMNHYIHPQLQAGDSPTAVFAKPAILQLIRLLNQAGSELTSLEAQIFGGASPHNMDGDIAEIGAENVKAAEEILNNFGIEIQGREVGGHQGRKIIFSTETGEIVFIDCNVTFSFSAPTIIIINVSKNFLIYSYGRINQVKGK